MISDKLEAIFTDETKWTKGNFAIDTNGIPCLTNNKNVCSFCLLGGIRKANLDFVYVKPLIYEVLEKYFPTRVDVDDSINISAFNDHTDTTFKDIRFVINKLRRIELTEQFRTDNNTAVSTSSPYHGRIYCVHSPSKYNHFYLHADGRLYRSCQHNNVYTGYFETEADVEKAKQLFLDSDELVTL